MQQQPTPRTPPGHPSDPTAQTPPGPNGGNQPPKPVTQTVYGLTVYLKSQRESNPMGIGVKVLAPDPETARSIINDAFGDDISTVSGPVTVTEGVYTESGPSALGKAPAKSKPEPVPPEEAHPSDTHADTHAEHKKR